MQLQILATRQDFRGASRDEDDESLFTGNRLL